MRSIVRISRQPGFPLLLFSAFLVSLCWPLLSIAVDRGHGFVYLLVVWLSLIAVLALVRCTQRYARRDETTERQPGD